MKRFTLGTTPIEVIRKSLPHKYNMDLNKTDMLCLLQCLLNQYEFGEDDGMGLNDKCLSLRTSILSTIGIEEI